MTTPPDFSRDNARFWEARGSSNVATDAVTLMAEHARYVQYVHDRETALLRRLLERRPKRVLDAGCGAGRLAVFLARHADEVVAMDLSQSLLDRARASATAAQLNNLTFLQASLGTRPDAGEFDLIVISGVLNYLTDDDAAVALEHCVEHLRPNGTLYMRNVCATQDRYYVAGTAASAPTTYRTSREYRTMIESGGRLAVLHEGYLFPPLCLPNMVYYHALPASLRDQPPVSTALDAWFALERATADLRLKLFTPLYGPLMRAIRKRNAFHVLVAQKR